ncbi:MAG: triose-phosphate isomerase [Fretibacterium sp.]|nr:triose-phosphate isomerase [Fretibacterium sp.]
MKKLSKLFIGTNTKMYKTIRDTRDFLSELVSLTSDIKREYLELFVLPSYTSLSEAKNFATRGVRVGAQNMCWEDQGQFTGETSPLMLQELGIDLVMLGHSERRHVFRETDQEENKKLLAAIKHRFTALLCVGETEEQKEGGVADEVLRMQLKLACSGLDSLPNNALWVAYEPVWAIGVSGKPATAVYASEKHAVIKECLQDIFGPERGAEIPVLYGGSVNSENAPQLIQQRCVDGLFIGRSAWQAESFNRIIRDVLPLFLSKK